MTKPIPEGYRTLTPYLSFDDAAEAIDWYKQAFGAKERLRMEAPGGKIGHAELEFGDSIVMLSDTFPQSTSRSPSELGGTTAGVFAYVENVDAGIRSATRGRSRRTWRTCHRRRSPSGRSRPSRR